MTTNAKLVFRTIGAFYIVGLMRFVVQTNGQQICTNSSVVVNTTNLIRNGGFETGAFDDLGLVCADSDYLCQSSCLHPAVSCGTLPSWTVYSGNINFGNYGSVCPRSSCAAEGDNFVDICGLSPGAMYQNVSVDVGATYRLSLQYAAHPGSDTCDTYYTRYFTADAQIVINNAHYRISHPSTTSFADLGWRFWSVDFTPTEPIVQLDIASLEFNCGCVFFDDVKIVQLNCATQGNSTAGTSSTLLGAISPSVITTETTVVGTLVLDTPTTSTSDIPRSTSSETPSNVTTRGDASTVPQTQTGILTPTSGPPVVNHTVGAVVPMELSTKTASSTISTGFITVDSTVNNKSDQAQATSTGRAKGTHVAFISAVVVAAVAVSGLLFIVIAIYRHKRKQRHTRLALTSTRGGHVANPTYECQVVAVSTDDFTTSPMYEAHVMDGITRMLSNTSTTPASVSANIPPKGPRGPASTPATMTVGGYTVPIMARARRATYGDLKYEDEPTVPTQWTNGSTQAFSVPHCISPAANSASVYDGAAGSVTSSNIPLPPPWSHSKAAAWDAGGNVLQLPTDSVVGAAPGSIATSVTRENFHTTTA